MRELTHLDAEGRARMVDVSAKPITARTAIAIGRVRMTSETLAAALSGDLRKGDVRAVAEIAGVMAGKRTADLIPLCHPLPLTDLQVTVRAFDQGLEVQAVARTLGQTGVEMEALTAVSVACLTIYDMLKALDRTMLIEGIRLLEKTGGQSGDYTA
jgi:cyclic pyranopterin phosphate synthase